MDFVDDDVLQVFKQLDPLGMMRQNTGMEHVRVGYDDMPRLPHLPAGGRRRVPVVCKGFNVNVHRFDQLVQLGNLIRRQRLCRKEIQRSRIAVFQNGVQHRQIVAHCFAGSRRRNHADIPALRHAVKRFTLMRIELIHAPCGQHRRQAAIQRFGKRRKARFFCRKGFPMRDIFHKGGRSFQAVNQLFKIHERLLSSAAACARRQARTAGNRLKAKSAGRH